MDDTAVGSSVMERIEEAAHEYFARHLHAPCIVVLGFHEAHALDGELDDTIQGVLSNFDENFPREIAAVASSCGVLRVVRDARRVYCLEVYG